MERPRSAIVVGGGIAGPAVAMALQTVGIDATVYEARDGDGDGDDGAFLTLATNGLSALRALRIDAAARAAAFPTPAITLRSGTGKRLGETPLGLPPDKGIPSHTLMRAELARLLRDAAGARGISIERGRRLVDAEQDRGEVRGRFDDGSEAVGDVLVGCDGVHSTVRRLVDPAAPAPRYSGLVGTGGISRGVGVDAPAGDYQMIFGRRAFFGYVVAPHDEVWWFANLPRSPEPPREQLAAEDARIRETLSDAFAADAGPALELIAATPRIIPLSPMHAVPHLRRWHDGRMVVVGDAAHAPTPSSGQGASLALEDAVVLARCLYTTSDGAGLDAFVRERRERVERIVKWGMRTNSSKAAGTAGRVLRDALLPVALKLAANGKAQRAIYEHRVELHVDAFARGAQPI